MATNLTYDRGDLVFGFIYLASLVLPWVFLPIRNNIREKLKNEANITEEDSCLWTLCYFLSYVSIIFSPLAFLMVLFKCVNSYEKLKISRLKSNVAEESSNQGYISSILGEYDKSDSVNISKEDANAQNSTSTLKTQTNTPPLPPSHIEKDDLIYFERDEQEVRCYFKYGSPWTFHARVEANINNYFVKKGQHILTIYHHNASLKKNFAYAVYAEQDGIITNCVDGICSLRRGINLYTQYTTPEAYVKAKYETTYESGIDSFTNKPFIRGVLIGGNKYGVRLGMLILTPELANGKHLLHINYDSKSLQISKKHTIYFLMEDDTVISKSTFSTPAKKDTYYDGYFHPNMSVAVVLNRADIQEFSTKKMKGLRITNAEGVNIYEIDYSNHTTISIINSALFKDVIAQYKKTLEQIHYEELELEDDISNDDSQKDETCYVYLMIDTTNNYHKIGISNAPRYREHTLQSEKPTIELLCSKEFPNRTIAKAIESALHSAFATKRIRGEWFNLSTEEVVSVKKTLE